MKKVITYGTFDLFHEGHYRLLQRAKELGDYLIVGVTTAEYDIQRGKIGVVDSLETRMENVMKTGFVDEVIIEREAGQKFEDIRKYEIDILTVGSDWVGHFDFLNDYCKVVYLERTKDISSTMLRTVNRPILRFGMIGTGRIANRFVVEAKLVSGVSTQGVYNPHIESAKAFAERWEIDCFETLDQLYESVDAVYIATPHETHYGYIKDALEHGKHVLCEKPMVLTEAHAREVYALAEEKKLVLFEGIKTAYCPGFRKLLGTVCGGAVGNIRNLEACFTKLEDPNRRELTDLAYGGSFLELGSYVLLPVIKIMGTEYEDIRFDIIKGKNGLDIFTRISLIYKTGFATLTCGLGVKSDGRLLVSGTSGYANVEGPWWLTTYFEVHHEDSTKVEKYSELFKGDGLRYEIGDFLLTIQGHESKRGRLSPKESIALAKIMEKFIQEYK